MIKKLEDYPLVLSVDEVAEILGVTPKTVRRLTQSEDLYSLRVGRLIRIPKESLIRFLHQDERR